MTIHVADLTTAEELHVGPMTVRILEDGTHTGKRIGVIEVTIPPGVEGPPQHIHHEHDETFYVVAGNPSFTCGNDTIHAKPGTLVTAPAGTPHTFANPTRLSAVLLSTVNRDLYIGYFREVAHQPAGPLDPAAVGRIMTRYATEVVL